MNKDVAMNHSELLGVSDGFALFGSDKGLTVVVNLSNLDVFDPIPQVSIDFARWGAADPALVPTEAYELADNALGAATKIEGTDILIAAGSLDKRSFATPRAAQAEAQKALAALGRTPTTDNITAVSINMAKTLASGGSVGIATVRHIARFFEKTEGGAAFSLWGGEPARKWVTNIIQRERDLAVLSDLDFEPEPEVDPDAEAPEAGHTPGTPHEYAADAAHNYACEVCGGEEFAIEHTSEYAEAEPEAVVAASGMGKRRVATSDEFFNVDIDAEDPIPDFYVVYEMRADGVPSMITDIYAHQSDDTWVVWSKAGHNWGDSAVPSDAYPIDEDSAYEIAILFDVHNAEAVPAQDIHPAEWDAVQAALPNIQDFESAALADIEFCVVMESHDKEGTVVIAEVYLRDESDACWRWNPVDVEWQQTSDCPSDCMPVDEKTAREAAARLTGEAHNAANGGKQNKGTFKPVPGANKESSPTLGRPRGPLRSIVSRTKAGPYEFDGAFGRAAWIKGASGAQGEFRGDGNTSAPTSFSIMELDATPGYTPEERSENASGQLRDSMGRFTKEGSVVHLKGSQRTAKVVAVDSAKGQFKVRYPDGTEQWRDASDVQRLKDTSPEAQAYQRQIRTRDNIVREARATDLTQKASLPYALPILSQEDITQMFTDYAAYIKKVREQEAGLQKHTPTVTEPKQIGPDVKDVGKKPKKLASKRRSNTASMPSPFSLFAALDPTTTDVNPLYIAQVDDLDKTAVVDLFAIVPKTKTSTDVVLYVRSEGGWQRDDKMLAKLKSTAPPPLVTLDAATFKEVLTQVDSYFKENAGSAEAAPEQASATSIIASLRSRTDTTLWSDDGTLIPVFEAQALVADGVPGVADTPGDAAAARRLKNYWLRGRGAAKIRWNTGGDWTRCVRHLSKYMGIRAQGYCQNLHKEATGMYTGDKSHRAMYGRRTLSAPTMVLASADDISADTQFLALLEVNTPTVKDLQDLTTRQAGHQLRIGERFLANGGDGLYTLQVLEPTSTIGWEGTPAVLVGGETYATLLQEA